MEKLPEQPAQQDGRRERNQPRCAHGRGRRLVLGTLGPVSSAAADDALRQSRRAIGHFVGE